MLNNFNFPFALSYDKDDNSCAVISYIFACKLREAIISVLTERAAPVRCSLNRVDAEKELRAC